MRVCTRDEKRKMIIKFDPELIFTIVFDEDELVDDVACCSRKEARALEGLIGEQPEFDVFLGRKLIEVIELPA